MILQAIAGTLVAYALIWGIFIVAPVSRSIVRYQIERLRADVSPPLIIGAAAGATLVALNVGATLTLGSHTFAGWSTPAVGLLALTLLYTGVVATTEELILRGVMLTRLRRWVDDPTAILVTALVFSVMHIGRRDLSLASVAQYAADGILLAWAAIRTGSIWFGVGWHWAKNLGVALAFGLSRNIMPPVVRLEEVSGQVYHGADLVTYLVGVPLAVLLILAITRERPLPHGE